MYTDTPVRYQQAPGSTPGSSDHGNWCVPAGKRAAASGDLGGSDAGKKKPDRRRKWLLTCDRRTDGAARAAEQEAAAAADMFCIFGDRSGAATREEEWRRQIRINSVSAAELVSMRIISAWRL